MRTRTYRKDVRAMPLLEALQAARVPVLAVRPPVEGGGTTTIDLGDSADDATVDAVLAAHDAAALDAAVEQDRTRASQDAALVKAYMNLATPTAAQTAAALKSFIRVARRTMADLKD